MLRTYLEYEERSVGYIQTLHPAIKYTAVWRAMDAFANAEEQSRNGLGPLSHIRNLKLEILLHRRRCYVVLGGPRGVHLWHEHRHRLGEDDTDWSDHIGVGELVKARMKLSTGLPDETQLVEERLIHTLTVLGNIRAPSGSASSSPCLPCCVWICNY